MLFRSTANCKIYPISLICSKEALREQIQKDIEAGIRTEDVISRSLQRIPLYENLDTIKIDVSTLLPEQVAEKIIELGR